MDIVPLSLLEIGQPDGYCGYVTKLIYGLLKKRISFENCGRNIKFANKQKTTKQKNSLKKI